MSPAFPELFSQVTTAKEEYIDQEAQVKGSIARFQRETPWSGGSQIPYNSVTFSPWSKTQWLRWPPSDL